LPTHESGQPMQERDSVRSADQTII